jgi:ABC-type transport system involved in multi-copper enzyme maturation permease subunit
MPPHSLEARSVIAMDALISEVLRTSSLSQVVALVVETISVFVIDMRNTRR